MVEVRFRNSRVVNWWRYHLGTIKMQANYAGITTDSVKLSKLSSSSYREVQFAVQSNPAVQKLVQSAREATSPGLLSQLANNPIRMVREAVAKNPNTPPNIIQTLSREYSREVAGNPSTPAIVIERLFNAGYKTEVLSNPAVQRLMQSAREATSPELLSQLADNPIQIVREAVAGNLNTPPHVLETLSKDKDIHMQTAVAGNPNTPPYVLETLSKCSYMQYVVQSNPAVQRLTQSAREATSPELLSQLADNPISMVREAVAKNPNTPVNVLETLSKCSNMQYVVQSNPAVQGLAQSAREATSPELLSQLADNPISMVREAVASNPNTPPHVLEKLSKDKDIYVQTAVASNQDIPLDVLLTLSMVQLSIVQEAIAMNPSTPPAILKLLANQGEHSMEIALNPNVRWEYVAFVLSGIPQDEYESGSHEEDIEKELYDQWVTIGKAVIPDYSYGYVSKSIDTALRILGKHSANKDKIIEKLRELNYYLYEALKRKI